MMPLSAHLPETLQRKASPLSTLSKKDRIHERSAKAIIILAVAIILTASFYQENLSPQFFMSSWGKILIVLFRCSLIIFILTLVWRVILVLRYRPARPQPDHLLPQCGVIVPAYNEGHQVLETLKA